MTKLCGHGTILNYVAHSAVFCFNCRPVQIAFSYCSTWLPPSSTQCYESFTFLNVICSFLWCSGPHLVHNSPALSLSLSLSSLSAIRVEFQLSVIGSDRLEKPDIKISQIVALTTGKIPAVVVGRRVRKDYYL